MYAKWVLLALLLFSCTAERALERDRSPIIHGQPCDESLFPSSIEIWVDAQVDFGELGIRQMLLPLCGGTVIAPRAVLTAAHCFDPNTITEGLGTLLSVRYRVGDFWATGFKQHENFELHPELNGLRNNHDLGVLYFEQDLPYPVAGFADIEPGEPIWIVGWGQTREDSDLEEQHTRMCAQTSIHEMGPWEMQIGSEGSSPRKCFGDSGGATYVDRGKDGYKLVGVTSRSYDSTGCAKGGIDTRVWPLREWISTAI